MNSLSCLLIIIQLTVLSCAQPSKVSTKSFSSSESGETTENRNKTTPDDTDYSFIELPVNFYVLSFENDPEFNATFSDSEIHELLNKANRVWEEIGIRFKVENIIPMTVPSSLVNNFSELTSNSEVREAMIKISESFGSSNVWSVALINRFPSHAGGVYLYETYSVFYAELNPDNEHHPQILAHELGHSLGLPHFQSTDNLMQSGQGDIENATELTNDQIATALERALIGPFTL